MNNLDVPLRVQVHLTALQPASERARIGRENCGGLDSCSMILDETDDD